MGFTLNQLEQERQIRKLQKKEDKDTSDYEQLSNLPKINNVELKGDKTGADLGIVDQNDIATVFSDNTNYTAGLFVYYEGTLYQFNADHSAGAWDPNDVVAANVTDQIVSNKAAIDGMTASDVAYDNTDSGLSATDVQGAVDEINNKLGTKKVLATATADGVKSLSNLLDELYPYRQVGAIIQVSDYAIFNTRYTTLYGCTSSDTDGDPVIRTVSLKQSGSIIKTTIPSTGATTDQSANVPTNGTTIELYIKL